MTNEIYTSSTLGEIPLSFTGRHLLQSLREAITEALEEQAKGGAPGFVYDLHDQAISRIRGKLAKRMSHLEQRIEQLERDKQVLSSAIQTKITIKDLIIHREPVEEIDLKELVEDVGGKLATKCFTAISLDNHSYCAFIITRMVDGAIAPAGEKILKILAAAQEKENASN